MTQDAVPTPRSVEGVKVMGDLHTVLFDLSRVSEPERTELTGWIARMLVLRMANPEADRTPALAALREIGLLCQVSILALSGTAPK